MQFFGVHDRFKAINILMMPSLQVIASIFEIWDSKVIFSDVVLNQFSKRKLSSNPQGFEKK